MRITSLFVILLTLACFGTAPAQTPDKAKLDQFFDQLAKKNKAMGSLCIATNGVVQYTRSIGYSRISPAEKQPATATTRYRIGSVTKMFTATMVLQLAEKGKLQLSDPIGKFFPQLPNAGKITVAHILAHRSGLHDVSGDPAYKTSRTTRKTKDEVLALLAKSTPDFEPGTKLAYNNSAYFLLGCLVEKVAGQSYEEALQKMIASKAGLKHTYPDNSDTGDDESASYRYATGWESFPRTHPSLLFGAGSLSSTPTDLAAFIHALFNKKLISQQSLQQMTEQQLGIDTFTFAGRLYYGHTGGVDGFGAWLAYLPEEKLAFAYATNGKVYPVGNIMDGITDIYWNRPFTVPSFESLEVSPAILDKYVGVYGIPDAPMKFTITRNGSTLYAQPMGQPAFQLEATAMNAFRIESPSIIFEFDAAKKQMTIKRNGGQKVFTKEN